MENQMARQAALQVVYQGKDISSELGKYLISLSYSDNPSGEYDDLQLTLADRDRLWQHSWAPAEGDKISATIKTINWTGPNEFVKLPCGSFEVDSCGVTGPPDQVQIGALSIPAGSTSRRQRNTRAWEKATLRTIAADISKNAGLKLLFEVPYNPTYDRIEQTNQTDMAFLMETCAREGVALKVSGGSVVLFDEAEYERKAPVCTITRGKDAVLSYSFSWSVADAIYRACVLTYTDNKGKTLSVTYTPPGAPKTGPVLKVNESAASPAEALRTAQKRLREQNKQYGLATLLLAGDPRMAASLTIMIAGWGRYDGKYIIERATHTVDGGGGYKTNIEIRKVLGW
ncbi:phage late control D family protein [Paenibacillus sp. P22]|uniref:phage late control D family protein n=1 Tax=Paenibacillus sp. P22 TaxID=483908 RepID=UPI000410606C|nr:phage late control protein [Paenibacillus sp. P22]